MSDIRYWLGFSLIRHVGPVRIQALQDYFGDLEAAWEGSAARLRAAGLPRAAIEQILYNRGRLDLDAELAKAERLGVEIISMESPEYPDLLRNIDYPPPVLYMRGDLLPADDWAVAIVGTRRPTTYGKDMARRLAYGLAENGITIVSGLALGIDGVAHLAALDAGGRTLAVLGCGVDRIYPARHKRLAERIMASGAVLSDYALGTAPEARNFPPRNRIISGLSRGTLVVEAGRRSGSLITLQFALEHGRETFAVPGSVYHRQSDGTNEAIKRGEAKLVTAVEDVMDELNLSMVVQQREVRQIVPQNDTEKSLLQVLDMEPVHIDEIVRRAQLPTALVSSTLCMMELKGMVRRVDAMSYTLAR